MMQNPAMMQQMSSMFGSMFGGGQGGGGGDSVSISDGSDSPSQALMFHSSIPSPAEVEHHNVRTSSDMPY